MKNASESLFCFMFHYYVQWLKAVYCWRFNTLPYFLLYCLCCLTVNYFISVLVSVWIAAEFLYLYAKAFCLRA